MLKDDLVFEVVDVGVAGPNIVDVVVQTREEMEEIISSISAMCEAVFKSKDKSIAVMKSGVIILVRMPRAVQTVR